jgi:hypothetical protein
MWFRRHLELFFWVSAMLLLFGMPVREDDTSLCVSTLLGLGPCPGCGIGHAIHYALHLQPALSVHHHPFGIFAVIVIFIRIKQLLFPKKTAYETQPH